MTQSSRIPITAEEKAELWQRWKSGESLSEIGRAFERHAATILRLSDPMVVTILIKANVVSAICHSKRERRNITRPRPSAFNSFNSKKHWTCSLHR